MFFRTGMKRVSLPFHAMPLSLLKRKITRYFGGPGTDSLSTICGMKYWMRKFAHRKSQSISLITLSPRIRPSGAIINLSVIWFRVFLLRRSYHQSVLFPCKAVIQFCHLCECPFSLYFVRLFFARALCRCLSVWQQPYRRQFAAPPVPLCVRTAAPSRPAGPARLFLSVRFHFIRAVFSL